MPGKKVILILQEWCWVLLHHWVLFCFVLFNLQEQRCKINTRALVLKIRRPRIQEMKYFASHNKNGQWAASLGSDRVPSACGFSGSVTSRRLAVGAVGSTRSSRSQTRALAACRTAPRPACYFSPRCVAASPTGRFLKPSKARLPCAMS